MSPKGMVLITGGCGFIGTNLTQLLLRDGFAVRTFDNLASGVSSPSPNSRTEFILGDIRDPLALKAAMKHVSQVIHLAAFGSVLESIADPVANFAVNAAGTLNVLQACTEAGINKFVFASTGGAAIGNHKGPVDEHVVPKPLSPYGASKLAGEVYCHAFAKSFGLNTVCLRFANIYGPHSAHKKGVLLNFFRAVRDNLAIQIYGDGTATRDFLYVDDLCQGIKLALVSDLPPGSLFHLASGVETSIEQLLRITLDIVGKSDHLVQYLEPRRGEVEHNVGSFSLAHRTFGFIPCTSLREGVASSWRWFIRQAK